ncbi:MAG: gliding motility-associated ABC transporter permease subunit GldF [Prevotellaceae bacterium]|jgi:ABC-2 type transport system permease protein|nr:gliding motility-associated ABC transporter permease subunit GldF [Prevotellaceae bacterium]
MIFALTKKEFRSFFGTATGYIVILIFLVGAALFLWVFPNPYNVLDSGYAALDGLFALAPWLFLFLCPAITMRLFAEEKQQGTLELLLARPASKRSIMLGKSLAGWLLTIITLLPTLVWFMSINLLAEPAFNVDSGAFWGSFIGLLFLSAIYVSIGVFASSISDNQVVAFLLAAVLCFALYIGFDFIGSLFTNGTISQFVRNIGIDAHYKSISRGVIDSRDLLYFIIVSAIFLFLTKKKLEKRQ